MKESKRSYGEPKCAMCGKCCEGLGFGDLRATVEDYKRWKREGREDILQHVWLPPSSPGFGDIWIDPKTGENLNYCPFFRRINKDRGICLIHDTRPEVCGEFWCEYSCGVGEKGKPYKRWADRKE